MCLACEMDALWFAEMEMAAPGTAGVPPALEDYPASLTLGSLERAGETPAVPGGAPAPSPRKQGEVKKAGETPALPSRFRREETGS
jgi:hypothetical protein